MAATSISRAGSRTQGSGRSAPALLVAWRLALKHRAAAQARTTGQEVGEVPSSVAAGSTATKAAAEIATGQNPTAGHGFPL